MERSKAGRNKRIPDGTSRPKPKYNNNKQNIVIFNKKRKKYNEIQLTKNKINLNLTNHPASIDK